MDRKHGGFRCCLALLLLYLVGSALCLAPVIEAGRAGSQKNAVSRSQPRRGRGLQEDNSVASQKEAAFSIKPVVQQEDSTTDGDATGARTTLNFLNDAKPARMMSSLLPNTISNVEDLLHVVPNFLTDYYETIRKSPSLPKRSTEAQGDSARSGELLSSLLGGLTGNGASPISFIKPLTTGVTQGLSNLLPGSASAILDSTADASAAGTGASPGIPTATTSGVSEDILSLISAQPWLSGLLAHSANPAAIPTLDALSQLLQEINTTGRLGRLSLPQPLSAFFHSQPSELQTALGNGVLSLLNAAYPQAAYAASGGLGSDLLKFNPGLTSGVVGMSIGFGLGQTTTPPVVGAPNTSPADAVGGAVGSLLPAAADGSTRTRQDVAVSGTYGGSLGGGLGAYGLGGGEGLGIAELLGSLNGRGGAQGRGSTGGAGGAAGGVRGSGNLGGSARKASDPTSAATLLSSGVGALPGAVNGVGNILTSGLSALRVPTTALFPTSGSSANTNTNSGLLGNGISGLGNIAQLARQGFETATSNGLSGIGGTLLSPLDSLLSLVPSAGTVQSGRGTDLTAAATSAPTSIANSLLPTVGSTPTAATSGAPVTSLSNRLPVQSSGAGLGARGSLASSLSDDNYGELGGSGNVQLGGAGEGELGGNGVGELGGTGLLGGGGLLRGGLGGNVTTDSRTTRTSFQSQATLPSGQVSLTNQQELLTSRGSLGRGSWGLGIGGNLGADGEGLLGGRGAGNGGLLGGGDARLNGLGRTNVGGNLSSGSGTGGALGYLAGNDIDVLPVNSPSSGAAASSSVSDTGLLSDLNGSGLLGSTADLAGLASGGGNGLGGLGSRIGGGALGAGGSGSRGRGGLLVTGTSSLGGQLNTLSSVTTTATKGRPVASSLTSGSPRASSIIPSAPPARGSGDIPPVSSEVTAQNSGLLPSVQNAGGRQDTVDALLGGAGRSGLSSASTFPDEPLSLPLRDFLNVSPRTIDLSAFDDNNLGIQLEGKSAVQDHVKREKRYSDFLPGKAGMSGEKYSVLEFTSNTHQASSTPYTSGKGGSPRWPAAASVVDSSLASSRASTHPAPGTFNESKGVRPGVSASASSKDIQGSLRQTEEASKPKGVLTEQDRSRPGEVIVYALRSAEISAAPEGLAQMAAQ